MSLNSMIQEAIASAADVAHRNRVLMQNIITPTASLESFDEFYTHSNDEGKGELLTLQEKKLIESLLKKLPDGVALDYQGIASIYRLVGGSEVVDLRLLKTICLLSQKEFGVVLESIKRDCINNETVMQVISSCTGDLGSAWVLVDKVAWPTPPQSEENGLAKVEATVEPLDAVTIQIPAAVFMAAVLEYEGAFNSSVVKIGPFSWNYNPRIVDDQGRFKLLIDGGKRGFSPNLSIMESNGLFYIVNGGTSIRALMNYAIERRDLHPAIRAIAKKWSSNQGVQFESIEEEEVGQLEVEDIRLLTNALPTLFVRSLSTSEAIHFIGIASNSHTPINAIHSGVDRDYVPSIAPLLFNRLIDQGVVRASVETLIRSALNFKAFMLNESLKITVLRGYFPVGCEEVGEGNPKAWGTAQSAGIDLSWLSLPYVVSFGESIVNIDADAVDNSKLHTKLLTALLLGKCSLPKGGSVHIEIEGSTIKKCYPTSSTTHGWYNRGVAFINAKFSYRLADGTFIKLDVEKRGVAKTTPEKTTPEKTTPEKTTPEKTTPEKTTPEKTTPEKTTPEKTTPEKSRKGKKKSAPEVDLSEAEGLLLDAMSGHKKKMTQTNPESFGASSTLDLSKALPNLLALGVFTDVEGVDPKDFIDELNTNPLYRIKKGGVETAKEFLAGMIAIEHNAMFRLAEVSEETLKNDRAALESYFKSNPQAAVPASTYRLAMRPLIGALHAKHFERLGGKVTTSSVEIEGDSGKIDAKIIGYLPPQKGAKLSTLVISLASLGEGVDEYLNGMAVPYASTTEMSAMVKIMTAALESNFFSNSTVLDQSTATAIVEKLIKVFSVYKK